MAIHSNLKFKTMKINVLFICAFMILLVSCKTEERKEVDPKSEELSVVDFYFFTTDSIKIFGDLHGTDKKASTILLFHQGGSNARAEYETIVPVLVEKGFNVMTIDQRLGGQIYGGYNRTIANIPSNSFDNGYTYCDAYNNLEGALDFIIEQGYSGKKILWGSSYSAALAIQLGSKRQSDINGILAFSPVSGGPMEACRPDQFFEDLKAPLLIMRPQSEMKNESSQNQLALAEKSGHQTYIAPNGVHGSSMLVKSRINGDASATWERVLSFLDDLEKKG